MTDPKGYLRAMLNRIYDDGGKYANRGVIRGCVNDDWKLANELLGEWQAHRFLQLLEAPERLDDSDICLKLLAHIPPNHSLSNDTVA